MAGADHIIGSFDPGQGHQWQVSVRAASASHRCIGEPLLHRDETLDSLTWVSNLLAAVAPAHQFRPAADTWNRDTSLTIEAGLAENHAENPLLVYAMERDVVILAASQEAAVQVPVPRVEVQIVEVIMNRTDDRPQPRRKPSGHASLALDSHARHKVVTADDGFFREVIYFRQHGPRVSSLPSPNLHRTAASACRSG